MVNYTTETRCVGSKRRTIIWGWGKLKEEEALSSLKTGLGKAGSWGSSGDHSLSKDTEAGY